MNNELLAVLRLYLQENFNLQEKKKKKKLSDKEIAALKPPKKKITQADILAMRGVFEDEDEELESVLEELISLSEKKRERKKASDIPGYAANRSSKQLKKLNKDTEKAQKGNLSAAEYEKMDKDRQSEKPKGEKTPKNPFSGKIGMKKENLSRPTLRMILESIVENELEERKKRKKRKKKKSKAKKKKTLSKKTMDTLKRKAKASGYTAGSLASEYRKGLGAFYSSGSRKGMGAHQWAMARVNSAIGKGNPSWANLKKSKAKKK